MTTLCTIFGATGAQGKSVARTLTNSQRFSTIRLVTRDKTSAKAHELLNELQSNQTNVTLVLVEADLSQTEQVDRALEGATHSFLVTDFYSLFLVNGGCAGVEGLRAAKIAQDLEFEQGKNWIDSAKKHNLEFVVLSGLENVSKLTNGR